MTLREREKALVLHFTLSSSVSWGWGGGGGGGGHDKLVLIVPLTFYLKARLIQQDKTHFYYFKVLTKNI